MSRNRQIVSQLFHIVLLLSSSLGNTRANFDRHLSGQITIHKIKCFLFITSNDLSRDNVIYLAHTFLQCVQLFVELLFRHMF